MNLKWLFLNTIIIVAIIIPHFIFWENVKTITFQYNGANDYLKK